MAQARRSGTKQRTRAGAAQSRREQQGLPRSMVRLKQTCVQLIQLWRKLESDYWADQHSMGKSDDDLHIPIEEGGERVSFAECRADLRRREKRLKDDVPPGVWRAAMREVEEAEAAEAAAAGI